VYLGVTLDRTLSYRQHLQKSAAKVKSRNNLLSKLAGSTWGANAETLRTSALAHCYTVAEYCSPVWSRSAYTNAVDAQLNASMRLISGTLRTTQLPWLPVLANMPPPHLRRKAACDKLLHNVELLPDWSVHDDVFNHTAPRLSSRKPIWFDMIPVDVMARWRSDWQSSSVVNKHLVCDPTVRPPGFNLHRSTWSMWNRFHTGQGCCAANLHKWHIAPSDK